MARRPRWPGTDDGFTMVELVTAVVIAGLITAVAASALILGIKTTDDAATRLSDSFGSQLGSRYLVPDVQSAASYDTKVGGVFTLITGCADAATDILRLVSPAIGAGGGSAVRYELRAATAGFDLVRTRCTLTSPVTTSSVVVARGVASAAAVVNSGVLELVLTTLGGQTWRVSSNPRPGRLIAGPTTTSSPTTTTVLSDTTPPGLALLEMFDTNGDGVVETIEATFDEPIGCQGGVCIPGRWTLANAPSGAGSIVGSVAVSGTKATVTITGGTTKNTAVGAFTVALSDATGGAIQDAAGNRAGFAAQAPDDKARPVPVSVTLENGSGAVAGTITPNKDSARITLSEVISAGSVCGPAAAGDVTVTVTDAGSSDVLTVTAAGCTVNFGALSLSADYVSATSTWGRSSANGSKSSLITVSGAMIAVEFGSVIVAAVRTSVVLSLPVYTPSASIADAAGNTMLAAPFTALTTSRF